MIGAYTAQSFLCLARRKFLLLPAVSDVSHRLVEIITDVAKIKYPGFILIYGAIIMPEPRLVTQQGYYYD